MIFKHWINPIFIGLLILFSLPIKLPALQQWIESIFLVTLPIKLSLYTLFLPPVAVLCLIWNRNRAKGIWRQLRWPLTIILFLFCWMWLGAIISDYLGLSLKHSGRYSILLLTFFAFLFALDSESSKCSSQLFSGIYFILMVLTFLDHYGQVSIEGILASLGMKIDLFHSGVGFFGTDWDRVRAMESIDNFIFMYPSSFFEHRNPYAIASVGVFFWGILNLKHSRFISSLVIISASWSLVISGSRNGLFTLILVLFLLLILAIRQNRHSQKIFVFALFITILLGVIFGTVDSETINRTKYSLNKLTSVRSYKDLEKMDLRFTMYRVSFEVAMRDGSIIGSGTKTSGHKMFDNSKDLASKYLPETRNSWAERYNSHNALLTIWIEMGWVGLLAVLLFLWLCFRPALRGSPLLMMPMLAVCVGQIFDYFVWEIFFMAFQSFFFAYFAAKMNFGESSSITETSATIDQQDEA